MIHQKINKKEKLCFLVKSGSAANIVIPVDSLAPIDYKRFKDMDAQGGELMRVMRDTTLDNGLNALVTYQDLLVVVVKPVEEQKKAAESEEEKTQNTEEEPVKRKAGRPKGAKNKAKTPEE